MPLEDVDEEERNEEGDSICNTAESSDADVAPHRVESELHVQIGDLRIAMELVMARVHTAAVGVQPCISRSYAPAQPSREQPDGAAAVFPFSATASHLRAIPHTGVEPFMASEVGIACSMHLSYVLPQGVRQLAWTTFEPRIGHQVSHGHDALFLCASERMLDGTDVTFRAEFLYAESFDLRSNGGSVESMVMTSTCELLRVQVNEPIPPRAPVRLSRWSRFVRFCACRDSATTSAAANASAMAHARASANASANASARASASAKANAIRDLLKSDAVRKAAYAHSVVPHLAVPSL